MLFVLLMWLFAGVYFWCVDGASHRGSPTVILTRPPYPTLRLDQILQYKAQQGVKIYVLLYKEVDYVGQSNDSLRSKSYLESLHPNIRAIRHPNKFVGGATAVLWSHHEKIVVIDRYRALTRVQLMH